MSASKSPAPITCPRSFARWRRTATTQRRPGGFWRSRWCWRKPHGLMRRARPAWTGMDRQTLRDWVVRDNEHGVDSVASGKPPGAAAKLSAAQMSELRDLVLAGPDPKADPAGSCLGGFPTPDGIRKPSPLTTCDHPRAPLESSRSISFSCGRSKGRDATCCSYPTRHPRLVSSSV
jgi:hypothetical protein